MEKNTRATKKQRELLSFIDGFIRGNNYGPSYREIMRALGYKSVSTVAIHVDRLIAAGYLVKRDHSARSLEVVRTEQRSSAEIEHEAWLKRKVQTLVNKETTTPEQAEMVHQAMEFLGIPLSDKK